MKSIALGTRIFDARTPQMLRTLKRIIFQFYARTFRTQYFLQCRLSWKLQYDNSGGKKRSNFIQTIK